MVTVYETQERRRQAELAADRCAALLKERFGVRAVHVFGSLAGDSPWHSRSDIDLAVEGLDPDDYVPALSALWELLPEGIGLDLVTLEDAPPELAARIKSGSEINMSEDPKLALKKDIEDEIKTLDLIVSQAQSFLQGVSEEPSLLEVNGAGKLVHDFYCGVERIFERIAIRLGPGLPAGESWHTLLLRGMETEAIGIRPAVIDHALALRLVDYLRFRHLFRHSYGYELQWEKLRPLLRELEQTMELFRQQVGLFLGKAG
jgi:predicted nucleotidyltransferase